MTRASGAATHATPAWGFIVRGVLTALVLGAVSVLAFLFSATGT